MRGARAGSSVSGFVVLGRQTDPVRRYPQLPFGSIKLVDRIPTDEEAPGTRSRVGDAHALRTGEGSAGKVCVRRRIHDVQIHVIRWV